MKINKFLLITIIVLILFNLGLGIYNTMSKKRIAYVRSGLVLEKFEGMIEARKLFDQKLSKWQSEYDTLVSLYNNKMELYQIKEKSLSANQKAEFALEIKKLEENINKYQENAEKNSATEKDKLSLGAVNQINDYIKEYAEKHNLSIVLGVTNTGNILYGEDAVDITEDIIKGLNKNYKK